MAKIMIEIREIRMDEAIRKFIDHKQARSGRKGTMAAYQTSMKLLRTATGNVFVSQVRGEHVDQVMRFHAAKGNEQGTRNNTISHLRQFFEWAERRGHMSPAKMDDPMDGWHRQNYEAAQPPFIGPHDWPTLFELADAHHPLHRAYFALGFYLMARGPSELGEIRLWDLVRSDYSWTAAITRKKTNMAADPTEMCNELILEMSRWMTIYNRWAIENLGVPLQREWYLIPRMRSAAAPGTSASENIREGTLYPHLRRHPGSFSRITYPVLKEFGFPVDDPVTGKPNRWGGTHTLRKSGARALFNELSSSAGIGRDRALRIVQSVLGHKTAAMTEHYIGLDEDRFFRNEVLRGQWMFGINDPARLDETDTNVSPIRRTRVDPDAVESALEGLPDWIRGAA